MPAVLLCIKYIVKILTNKLQSVIGEVVSDAQSDFIPNRHIVDTYYLLLS